MLLSFTNKIIKKYLVLSIEEEMHNLLAYIRFGETCQRTPKKNLIKISFFLEGVFGVMTCFHMYGNTMLMGIEQTMYRIYCCE